MCKTFFVKDFSGTTAPKILKFGTNVGHDLMFCVKENQSPPLIIPLFVHFSFRHRVLGSYESQSSNFVDILTGAKYVVGKKTKMM